MGVDKLKIAREHYVLGMKLESIKYSAPAEKIQEIEDKMLENETNNPGLRFVEHIPYDPSLMWKDQSNTGGFGGIRVSQPPE